MKEKDHSLLDNLAYVIKNIFSWKKSLLVDWVFHIIISGISVFMLPYLIKVIISQIEKGVNFESFILFIVGYTIFALIVYTISCFCENNETWKHEYVRVNFVKMIMETSLTMDYDRLENPKILDDQQKAMNAVREKTKGIPGILSSCVKSGILVVQILAAGGIIFTLNPIMVILMLGLVLVQFLPVNYTKEKDKREVWDTLAAPWRKLFQLNRMARHYESAKDLRLYNMGQWVYEKQLEVNHEVQEKVDKSGSMWIRCHAIVYGLKFLQELLLYAYLVYCILNKGMMISDFTFYIAAVASFSKAVGDFLWEYAGMRTQSNEINDFRTFIVEKTRNEGTLDIKEFLKKTGADRCEFVFENVSFCYEGQTKNALTNVNLKIEAGKKLAIVGMNGAGKTTLIKLLCRLYDPTEGRILLNGTDIKEFDRIDYFSVFSPVFQNVEMYAFPLSQNISMQPMEKTDLACVKDCVKRADLEKKVSTLRHGIDTEMTKMLHGDGVELSGGEKQKLALARALYKDAPVVLLDEPTAAMDAIAEYELYSKFSDLVQGKTSMYISHRLSSTRFCDVIAMFEDGQLVELGSHTELLEKQGKYAHLYNVQAQYYQDEEEEK